MTTTATIITNMFTLNGLKGSKGINYVDLTAAKITFADANPAYAVTAGGQTIVNRGVIFRDDLGNSRLGFSATNTAAYALIKNFVGKLPEKDNEDGILVLRRKTVKGNTTILVKLPEGKRIETHRDARFVRGLVNIGGEIRIWSQNA